MKHVPIMAPTELIAIRENPNNVPIANEDVSF
jgi:hypothetical protein